MHATNSLKVRLSARTRGSKFPHHACAKSFMALSCSFFVRGGINTAPAAISWLLELSFLFWNKLLSLLSLIDPCDSVQCASYGEMAHTSAVILLLFFKLNFKHVYNLR